MLSATAPTVFTSGLLWIDLQRYWYCTSRLPPKIGPCPCLCSYHILLTQSAEVQPLFRDLHVDVSILLCLEASAISSPPFWIYVWLRNPIVIRNAQIASCVEPLCWDQHNFATWAFPLCLPWYLLPGYFGWTHGAARIVLPGYFQKIGPIDFRVFQYTRTCSAMAITPPHQCSTVDTTHNTQQLTIHPLIHTLTHSILNNQPIFYQSPLINPSTHSSTHLLHLPLPYALHSINHILSMTTKANAISYVPHNNFSHIIHHITLTPSHIHGNIHTPSFSVSNSTIS